MRPSRIGEVSLAFTLIVSFSSLSAQGQGLDRVVLLATNSIHLQQGSEVTSGDVVVNAASPGPTLGCQRELCIGLSATTSAGFAVKADSIQVKSGAVVGGDVVYGEDLLNNGTIGGTVSTGLALPVFATLPPFAEAAPRDGAPDVLVAQGSSIELPPGDYGLIDVDQGGSVVFSGGVYNVREVDAGLATGLLFAAPSELRVAERFSLDQGSVLGPSFGSGLAGSDVIVYVAGINGSTGALGATPKAAKLGLGSTVAANFYVPNGTLWIRQGATVTGAFIARDIDVGLSAEVGLESFFANRPPVAAPQTVLTAGASAVEILLEGSDPEGEDLAFTIAVPPTEGELSTPEPIVPDPVIDPGSGQVFQPPIASATVLYTPDVPAEDREDAFTFEVSDPWGLSGTAVVTINPPGDPTEPPTPSDEIVARDAGAETARELPVPIVLTGDGPAETSLFFSIVEAPGHGTLSAVIQGSEAPRRTAKVVYTPEDDFSGDDSFVFRAEDEADPGQFDDGTITVAVAGALAEDQTVATDQGQPVEITLTGTPGAGQSAAERRITLAPRAAFLDGAELAGNVADADGDGAGDNHNALPGPAPVAIAAAVDAAGGAGSNGTLRLQIEWDLSQLGISAASLESAQVLLTTDQGSVDSLDTFFFAGTGEQDGLLTDSDFEAPAAPVAGAVMPVTPGVGTFSFDVTREVREALDADRAVFSIQGRVDETLAGTGFARGLQIRSTADGNLADPCVGLTFGPCHPQLAVATPGVTPPAIVFSITRLPAHGTLVNSFGQVVACSTEPDGLTCTAPASLPGPRLTYAPDLGFVGIDTFLFQAEDFLAAATALVTIDVLAVDGCGPDGRDPGCAPARCADGHDNDGDGLVDGADPQCSGPLDDDEGG
jgi:hypothetical protein